MKQMKTMNSNNESSKVCRRQERQHGEIRRKSTQMLYLTSKYKIFFDILIFMEQVIAFAGCEVNG
ncbi:UNVERIFIED_CONTAM: hypothetical protein NCL1_28012 [Trichonephila clavipes]